MSPEQPSRLAGMGNDWRIADRPNKSYRRKVGIASGGRQSNLRQACRRMRLISSTPALIDLGSLVNRHAVFYPRHRGRGRRAFGENLAPIAVRARHLLAVNLGTASATELLKLGVERLPVGADAGVAEKPVLRVSFQSYFTANVSP